MSLITKTVQIKVRTKTIKEYYDNLGYECDVGNIINIKVEHLTKGSTVLVNVKCDCESCENPILNPIIWHNYLRYVKEDGTYYCHKCSMKLFGNKKHSETKLKNGISFEKWCIENNREDILDRWDYELNNCIPSEINFSTNKKYYFKCPRGIHKSELKSITCFTSGQEGSIKCNQCNSFAQWCIDNICDDFLEKYWDYNNNININPWVISKSSDKKVWIKCQENNYHNNYLVRCAEFTNGTRCPYCAGKLPSKDNNLLFCNPKLCEEWDYIKNEKRPEEYCPNSKKKVWWKCKERHEWKATIKDRNNNRGCPECNESKGEKRIKETLLIKNIPHDSQYKFNDLKGIGGGLLKFDVPVFWDKEKTNLRMLVEFDGIFHYEKQYDDDKFETLQHHDKLKNEYCQNNNIKLLRIPYWDFDNIEQILEQHLNLLKVVV